MIEAIKVDSLTKSYQNGDVLFNALSDVSFAFPSRGFFFILGKSGSGKSTLLNIIGGIEKPTSGSVKLDRTIRFAYVFQDENFLFSLSLLDNLRLVNRNEEEIAEALQKVGLTEKSGTQISLLSKGERARLAMAKSLLSGANAILLDEPTGNLDSTNSDNVFTLLKAISKEILVIAVTHDKESAKKYGDVILTLEDGKLTNVAGKVAEGEEAIANPKPIESRIPLKIALNYALRKAFARKTKMILSLVNLVVSSALLIADFSILLQDRTDIYRKAMSTAPSEYYSVGQPSLGDGTYQHITGIDFYEKIVSMGASHTIITCPFDLDTGNSFAFAKESMWPSKTWADLQDNEIAISDWVASQSALPIGSSITSKHGQTCIVKAIYQTNYEALISQYGEEEGTRIAIDNDVFVFANPTTYGQNLIKTWSFNCPDFFSRSGELVYLKSYSSSLTLSEGSVPVSPNEVTISKAFVENGWPNGDSSLVLGHEFALSHDKNSTNPIEDVYPSLKIVGIVDGDYANVVRFGSSFYSAAEEILSKDGSYFVSRNETVNLLPLLLDNYINLSANSGTSSSRLMAPFIMYSFLNDTWKFWFGLCLIFSLLAVSFLLLYSLDNIKNCEKDIALLKLAGKSNFSIVSLFWGMNNILSVVALPFAIGFGIGGAYLIGEFFKNSYYIGLNIISISWLGIGAAFLLLLIVPFLVSLLILKKVQKKEAASVFKRNLV